MCPSGYTGTTCSQALNLCTTVQCLNGGTCSNYGTFALCNCLINFTGERCQYVNQCYPVSPCLYGGTCISVLNSFSCQCPTGRTGTTCQLFSDDPCAGGNRCLNGGTCVVLSGTTDSTCMCPINFTGQSCEQGPTKNRLLQKKTTVSLHLAVSSTQTTTASSSVLTMLSEKSSTVIATSSMAYFNITNAPYSCDDTSLACLAYSSYCNREYEFSGIPCRVLCPRTCNTCKIYFLNSDTRCIFSLHRLRRLL